jgi:hypothetical protein
MLPYFVQRLGFINVVLQLHQQLAHAARGSDGADTSAADTNASDKHATHCHATLRMFAQKTAFVAQQTC